MPRTRRNATLALFSAGIGAALAWSVFSALDEGREMPASTVTYQSRASAMRDEPPAKPDGARMTVPRAEETTDSGTAVPPEIGVEASPPATTAGNPIVSDIPPRDLPVTPTDLPNRRPDDLAARVPAAALLGSTRITCDFGAGNNTGLRFGDTLSVGGGAQWQGGLMIYDLVDTTAGAAVLRGSVGATGSPIGEARMQVATEGTRLMFSGFLPNRAFVAVTIFDEIDNVGRHIAVMSRHEGFFEFGSQFLGTCE